MFTPNAFGVKGSLTLQVLISKGHLKEVDMCFFANNFESTVDSLLAGPSELGSMPDAWIDRLSFPSET